jgi:hypothetical protein
MNTKLISAVTAALMLSATAAQATVLLARINPTGILLPAAPAIVPLSPALPTGSFTVPAAGIYVITFSAECAVAGIGKYMTLEIAVDGIVRSPTIGTNDSFCASDHTLALDNYSFHSISVPVSLSAGAHTLMIRSILPVPGSTQGSLDDYTTIIDN